MYAQIYVDPMSSMGHNAKQNFKRTKFDTGTWHYMCNVSFQTLLEVQYPWKPTTPNPTCQPWVKLRQDFRRGQCYAPLTFIQLSFRHLRSIKVFFLWLLFARLWEDFPCASLVYVYFYKSSPSSLYTDNPAVASRRSRNWLYSTNCGRIVWQDVTWSRWMIQLDKVHPWHTWQKAMT